MGFFDQKQIQPVVNPEPQGFDILRQWLMQRAGQQFANPYGMSPQGMAGLQQGGGGGDLFQVLMGLTRPAFDPYSQGMPQGPNSQPMGGGGGMRTQPGRTRQMPMRGGAGPRPSTQYDGQQQDETQYDGVYWNQANTQAPPMSTPPMPQMGGGGIGIPPGPMPRPLFGGGGQIGMPGHGEPGQMPYMSGGTGMPGMGQLGPPGGAGNFLEMLSRFRAPMGGGMGGPRGFEPWNQGGGMPQIGGGIGAPAMRTLPMQQGGQAPPMTTQPVRPQQPMPNYRAMALPALMSRMGTRGNF